MIYFLPNAMRSCFFLGDRFLILVGKNIRLGPGFPAISFPANGEKAGSLGSSLPSTDSFFSRLLRRRYCTCTALSIHRKRKVKEASSRSVGVSHGSSHFCPSFPPLLSIYVHKIRSKITKHYGQVLSPAAAAGTSN